MAGVGNSGGGGGGAVRAGRAFVELFADDNRVYRALDRLRARFQKFGSITAKAGAGLGAAGLTALAPLKPALDSITESSKLGDTADAFGLTAEKASRLFGIMQAGGSDLRDATEGVVTFNQRISDAIEGKGEEAVGLFKDLGKSADSFSGDTSDKFFQLLDALRQVPDPAKRVQLLLKAVGEDTGKNLIPLLSMSADQVAELGDAFQQSGEDVKASREATRAYNLAVAELGKVWREASAAVIPIVKDVATEVRAAAKPVGEFVAKNRESLRVVIAVAAGLAGAGAALVALGGAAGLAATVIGGAAVAAPALAAGVALILSPVGLVVAGFVALGAGLAYLLAQTDAGAEFFGWIGNGFRGAADTAKTAWGGIVDALRAGDLSLAARVALAGLEVAWGQLWLNLKMAWIGFKSMFVDGWHDLTETIQLGMEIAMLRVFGIVSRGLDRVLTEFARVSAAIGQTDLAGGATAAAEQLRLYGRAAERVERQLAEAAVQRSRERDRARVGEARAAMAQQQERARALDDLRAAARQALDESEALSKAAALAGVALGVVFAQQARGGALAATIAGSGGTFNATAAAQRFGNPKAVQKRLGDIADNTAATVRAAEGIAKALTFK